ncbi:MAG: T9SS type A sorting domain-containing protein [Saprospiraceae bacterium]|nr:T9SS type A sorting domain-containing protein [Saprospiraceae bacterium]
MKFFTSLIFKKVFIFSFASCLFGIANAQVNVNSETYYDNVEEVAVTSVSVTGFNKITGMQWTLEYDTSVFEIDDIMSSGILPGIGSDNFYFYQPGFITFLWIQPGSVLNGETIPDGSEIYRIKSKLKSAQPGDFCITGSVTPFEVNDDDNRYVGGLLSCNQKNGIFKGTVFIDENADCDYQVSEPSLKNWYISFNNGTDSYFTTTNSDGEYFVFVPEGTYDISLIPKSDIWDACNQNLSGIEIETGDVLDINLGAESNEICPAMEVNLSTSFLRRCFPSTYYVDFCNHGSAVANQSYVVIDLDPYLTYLSSSIPFGNQNGNSYTFYLGDVAPGDCNQFSIEVLVDCDSTVLGQTHCTTATIYPNSPCTGGDEKPNLKINKDCVDGQASFSVKNIGNKDMDEPAFVTIYEDGELSPQSIIQLNIGEEENFSFQADGVSITMQILDNLLTGSNLLATTGIEGCGRNLSGEFSKGFISQFPLGDDELWIDIDCRENRGAYDPNDKTVFPGGFGNEKIVKPGVALEYLVRFQNTGTDTAFKVVILDTLDTNLDPATLQTGASSHPCEIKLLDKGIIKVTFDDILLPDSTVNEAASHGFIQYKIKPKNNLANFSKVKNRASIYFDFNDPIITNTTLQTIGSSVIIFTNTDFISDEISMRVYPNPATDNIQFSIQGNNIENLSLCVYDTNGKTVFKKNGFEKNIQLERKNLPAGLYFFSLHDDQNNRVSSGRIIFQ